MSILSSTLVYTHVCCDALLHMSIHMFTHMSVHMLIHISIHMSIHMSILMSEIDFGSQEFF